MMIIEQIKVGHMGVFCYIVSCARTKNAVIIDPGGEEQKILDLIRERGLTVSFIINTHNHPDHTFSNRKIKQAVGAPIVLHENDKSLMDDDETVQIFRRIDFPVSDTPPADRLVREGDRLAFGECSLRVIHTPGHSPGGMCLLGNNNLFTGDSLFVGGAGRVDLPYSDFHTLMDALEKKIAPLPDATIVWPGHDYSDAKTSTIAREKKENPYLGGEW